MTYRGAEFILKNKEKFSHLKRLIVFMNYLSDDIAEKIRSVCPEVISYYQKEIYEDDPEGWGVSY
ncbi:MAG: hypothetical protein OEZ34_03235 [Spirochaetia bacterium]|nr:hypothetical protein [Spirochaetia bacterium]